MARIASFHLVRERPGRQLRVLARLAADRPRLRSVDGLAFWRLLGTGRGTDTARSVDLRRSALFAVWDDEAHLDAFLRRSEVARRWRLAEESWHVRLRSLGGHGSWRGADVLAGLSRGQADGPLAVVTRADVRLAAWWRFDRAGPAVSSQLAAAPGMLRAVGVGEAPVGRLATFSLWQDVAAMRAFAASQPHAEVVRRTRRERWYGEELFARFEPYGSEGTWDGGDPLARRRT
jgi:heme-degrading monooxygenase HmoA